MDILNELKGRLSDNMDFGGLAASFFEICKIEIDTYEQEFIFETGNFGGCFEVHFVRQYEDDEIGEFMQLSLDIVFPSSPETKELNTCSFIEKADQFIEAVKSSAELSLLSGQIPEYYSVDLCET